MTGKAPQSPKEGGKAKVICRALVHALKNNWGFKLLALLIAIVLWAGLITQDPTLTREKSFSDVTINVTGSDAIKRNGFIVVSDLSQVLEGAHLRVDVPQMQYANAQAGFYNVRIDLSRVTEAGVQQARVLTTNSSTYGTVSEITPSTVEIEVEEYITRYRIPVTLDVVGTPPTGYYAATPVADPSVVAVSGPKSLVDQISRAEAVVELGNLPAREGTIRQLVSFRLLDEKNNEVQSDLLEVTSESVLMERVTVETAVYSLKAISLSDVGLVTGSPAEGYEVKSVVYTPEIITAAGKMANLSLLDTLYADESVDITGLNEPIHRQIKVRRPSELTYLSASSVTVEVEIGPIIESRTFEDVKISLGGVADGLRGEMAGKTADVTITGPQLWIDSLKNNSVKLMCDASGLTAGTYSLPLICQISGSEEQTFSVEVAPENMEVTISER